MPASSSPVPREHILEIYPPNGNDFGRFPIYTDPRPSGEVYHYYNDVRGVPNLIARTTWIPWGGSKGQPAVSWSDVATAMEEGSQWLEKAKAAQNRTHIVPSLASRMPSTSLGQSPNSAMAPNPRLRTRTTSTSYNVGNMAVANQVPRAGTQASFSTARIALEYPQGIQNGRARTRTTSVVNPSRDGVLAPQAYQSQGGLENQHRALDASPRPHQRVRTTSNAPHIRGFTPERFPSAPLPNGNALLFQPIGGTRSMSGQ